MQDVKPQTIFCVKCGCGKPFESHWRGWLDCPTNGQARRGFETEAQRDERMIMEAFPDNGMSAETLEKYKVWKNENEAAQALCDCELTNGVLSCD